MFLYKVPFISALAKSPLWCRVFFCKSLSTTRRTQSSDIEAFSSNTFRSIKESTPSLANFLSKLKEVKGNSSKRICVRLARTLT